MTENLMFKTKYFALILKAIIWSFEHLVFEFV